MNYLIIRFPGFLWSLFRISNYLGAIDKSFFIITTNEY